MFALRFLQQSSNTSVNCWFMPWSVPLELGKISEAQAAFDRAIDAIDRSGMKKDARKGMAANLQEAFINLAKSVEENPPPPTDDELQNVSSICISTFCWEIWNEEC